ncbi:uncharacterized protein LOC130789095 [Actinidia eriantha]|uniref:uncharacterized protein LOC130789095 n=1 Tax=Actinidia eriantha TaxID=165200 RepID=UPI00258863B8|nr:uncharacterized protein LOC130789095 [Actinidia eriantha]
MGGTRSSSKRKSSSRKSSKISSEARRKKTSKRTKSRKLRRRGDDSSSYSDDSISSVSISSSSSEDEYTRARSRTRSEVKGSSRKRTRRSSSSRGSGEDSRRVKKRKGSQKKGSKKSANSDTRKISKKKKRRIERSVSSISSGGESKVKRPRGRSRGKSKDKSDLGKAKSETKSNRNRSRSCSSCNSYSESSGPNNKDILPAERRLRSVITVAKSPEGERKVWDKDGPKEEIEYDHDDYPSCRSNDSNDGGIKKEITHHSHVDLGRWGIDNVKGEEALVYQSRVTELTCAEVDGVHDCRSNSHSDGDGANNSSKENKKEVFPSLFSSNGDDLESTLRLKALENLRKYRGGHQTNAKAPADEKHKSGCEAKQLSTAKVELVHNSSPKEDHSGVVDATRILDQNPSPTRKSESSHPATSYGKARDGKDIVTECASSKQSVIRPPNQGATSGNSKKEDLSPKELLKSQLHKSAPRQESSGGILKQTRNTNMLVAESTVNKMSTETTKSVGQSSNHSAVAVNNLRESSTSEPSSSPKPILEEHSSKDQQGEVKEGSQFEQKTMSVIRGGERVQVTYKVYIPKKAPALARRQLRR